MALGQGLALTSQGPGSVFCKDLDYPSMPVEFGEADCPLIAIPSAASSSRAVVRVAAALSASAKTPRRTETRALVMPIVIEAQVAVVKGSAVELVVHLIQIVEVF